MDIENCPCSEDNSCSDVQCNSDILINTIEENSINLVQELLIFENNTLIESFIVNTTTLYNKEVTTSSEVRKTAILHVEIYKMDMVMMLNYYKLVSNIQKITDYNMSIITFLTLGQDNNFETSETLINFSPMNKSYTTLEEVKFNSNNIKLSKVYSQLGKASKKLAEVYNKQEMPEFEANYKKIANELKLLSQFVKIECEQYNLEIYDSQATISDNWIEEAACLFISSFMELYPDWAQLSCLVFCGLVGAAAAVLHWIVGIVVGVICGYLFYKFDGLWKTTRDAICRLMY